MTLNELVNGFRQMGRTSLEDLRNPLFWRALVAEFVGTMFLVFIGCGSCIEGWTRSHYSTMVQISLAFGFSVATMIWCIAHISGGHINPAVTIAMAVTRKISILRMMLYIIFQSTGAVVGAGILKGLTPKDLQHNLGATIIDRRLVPIQAFGVEFMITFVLVFTIFATCDSKRKDLEGSGPLAIGISVIICHLFAIKYTGASMNSARSFGPAVVQGIWDDHWVFWVGPIVGGITAALLYDYLFSTSASRIKVRNCLLTVEGQTLDNETKEVVVDKMTSV